VERSLSEIESYNAKLVVVGGGYGYTKEPGVTEIFFNGELKCRGGNYTTWYDDRGRG
jgi:hypothetical protein